MLVLFYCGDDYITSESFDGEVPQKGDHIQISPTNLHLYKVISRTWGVKEGNRILLLNLKDLGLI